MWHYIKSHFRNEAKFAILKRDILKNGTLNTVSLLSKNGTLHQGLRIGP